MQKFPETVASYLLVFAINFKQLNHFMYVHNQHLLNCTKGMLDDVSTCGHAWLTLGS